MNEEISKVMFTLLRSAICSTLLSNEEKSLFDEKMLPRISEIAKQHDLLHLLALGLKRNGLLNAKNKQFDTEIYRAVYRYEQQKYELSRLCDALENAGISFVPLKGSILRQYYPEPWMRTSCDIDILVHSNDLDVAIACLADNLGYVVKERGTHDVSLFSSIGIHIEIHFDLVEEGRANNAIDVLRRVWENVKLHEGTSFCYEMTDAFFYFYHVAHMAKHFETGGCGIRPFLDLWILDHKENVDQTARDQLLVQGGLFQFAGHARRLSQVWFEDDELENLLLQLQEFILHGGLYGSVDNRVALQQTKTGGKWGYILSRIFIPYAKLKRYYPILEKHPWLTPVMQIRRWFMLFRPDVMKRTKREIKVNRNLDKSKANEMNIFLKNIGL